MVGVILAFGVLMNWSITGAAIDLRGSSGIVSTMSIDSAKSVVLSISANEATVLCNVTGDSGNVTKIAITMYLQKKNSSGVWENYKTWNGSKSGYCYALKKTTLISRGTYRVKAKVTCYKGTTSQTTYHYSASRLY